MTINSESVNLAIEACVNADRLDEAFQLVTQVSARIVAPGEKIQNITAYHTRKQAAMLSEIIRNSRMRILYTFARPGTQVWAESKFAHS